MICNCFTCPLDKENHKHSLLVYEKLNEEPCFEELIYDVRCSKIGGKGGWYGYCEDAFEEYTKPFYKAKKKQSTKFTRREKYQQQLKHLNRIANYPAPSIYVDEKWDNELRCYIPVDKPYYKRCYRGNHKGNRYRYYKRYSNKVVRHYEGDLHNGKSYKKIYDFWWSVD